MSAISKGSLTVASFLLAFFIFALTLSAFLKQAIREPNDKLLLNAARVFDGESLHENFSVLVENGLVTQVGPINTISKQDVRVVDLGDATILPGFIDLHTYLAKRGVSEDIVLRHGITTLRDIGSISERPRGGDSSLRVITSGPILSVAGGYPSVTLGAMGISREISTEADARSSVREWAESGAALVNIIFESEEEASAPWGAMNAKTKHHASAVSGRVALPHSIEAGAHWSLPSETVVKALVDEAHRNGLKVAAHLNEENAVRNALAAGIDEWAHIPCAPISPSLLKQAVEQGVAIVSTMDTLSKCAGAAQNAETLVALGANLLYGAAIGHLDIPWGIDAQELQYLQSAGMTVLETFKAATSDAGAIIGVSQLGTLTPGAPADIIAVIGNPAYDLKILEYPDLVVSGGKIVVDNFQR